MTSLFPGEVRAAQPDFDRDELPDAVRNDFGQLLDWFTPNIFVCWIVFGVKLDRLLTQAGSSGAVSGLPRAFRSTSPASRPTPKQD